MNLDMVAADLERLTEAARTVVDSKALVNDTISEIRTISYLLHPLMLDEAGLQTALRTYIKGSLNIRTLKAEPRCVNVDRSEQFSALSNVPADFQ